MPLMIKPLEGGQNKPIEQEKSSGFNGDRLEDQSEIESRRAAQNLLSNNEARSNALRKQHIPLLDESRYEVISESIAKLSSYEQALLWRSLPELRAHFGLLLSKKYGDLTKKDHRTIAETLEKLPRHEQDIIWAAIPKLYLHIKNTRETDPNASRFHKQSQKYEKEYTPGDEPPEFVEQFKPMSQISAHEIIEQVANYLDSDQFELSQLAELPESSENYKALINGAQEYASGIEKLNSGEKILESLKKLTPGIRMFALAHLTPEQMTKIGQHIAETEQYDLLKLFEHVPGPLEKSHLAKLLLPTLSSITEENSKKIPLGSIQHIRTYAWLALTEPGAAEHLAILARNVKEFDRKNLKTQLNRLFSNVSFDDNGLQIDVNDYLGFLFPEYKQGLFFIKTTSPTADALIEDNKQTGALVKAEDLKKASNNPAALTLAVQQFQEYLSTEVLSALQEIVDGYIENLKNADKFSEGYMEIEFPHNKNAPMPTDDLAYKFMQRLLEPKDLEVRQAMKDLLNSEDLKAGQSIKKLVKEPETKEKAYSVIKAFINSEVRDFQILNARLNSQGLKVDEAIRYLLSIEDWESDPLALGNTKEHRTIEALLSPKILKNSRFIRALFDSKELKVDQVINALLESEDIEAGQVIKILLGSKDLKADLKKSFLETIPLERLIPILDMAFKQPEIDFEQCLSLLDEEHVKYIILKMSIYRKEQISLPYWLLDLIEHYSNRTNKEAGTEKDLQGFCYDFASLALDENTRGSILGTVGSYIDLEESGMYFQSKEIRESMRGTKKIAAFLENFAASGSIASKVERLRIGYKPASIPALEYQAQSDSNSQATSAASGSASVIRK